MIQNDPDAVAWLEGAEFTEQMEDRGSAVHRAMFELLDADDCGASANWPEPAWLHDLGPGRLPYTDGLLHRVSA